MNKMSNWKRALTSITLTLLSLIGVKTVSATTTTPKATQPEELGITSSFNNSETLLAQTCSNQTRHKSPRPYSRVTTQGGTVNVRSGPNGRVIGSIPNGWQVITVRKDATGRWTNIISHFIDDVGPVGFANAPRFRNGWVSTSFLRALGRFCDKPMELMRSDLNTLSGTKKILVNEDWMQMGDRISRAIPKQ